MDKDKKKEKLKIENTIDLEDAIEESTNSALLLQNRKHKRRVVTISLVIVVLIAILGIGLYILNNPRLIFNAAINNMYNTLESNVIDVKDYNISTSGVTGKDYNYLINEFNNKEISEENILPIITGLKNAFLESINGEKIIGTDMTIKVNNQEKRKKYEN